MSWRKYVKRRKWFWCAKAQWSEWTQVSDGKVRSCKPKYLGECKFNKMYIISPLEKEQWHWCIRERTVTLMQIGPLYSCFMPTTGFSKSQSIQLWLRYYTEANRQKALSQNPNPFCVPLVKHCRISISWEVSTAGNLLRKGKFLFPTPAALLAKNQQDKLKLSSIPNNQACFHAD